MKTIGRKITRNSIGGICEDSKRPVPSGYKSVFTLVFVALAFPLDVARSETVQDGMEADAVEPKESQSWKLEAGLLVGVVHDDNLFIQPTDEEADTYVLAAPILGVGQGNFRGELVSFAPIPHFLVHTGEEELPRKNFSYLSYSPEFLRFSHFREENVINHDARLALRREAELWNAQGQVHFQRKTAPNIDVGRRLTQTHYTMEANAGREISAKVNGGAEAYANRSEYAGGHDSMEGRAGGFVDYQITAKMEVGTQLTVGYLDVASGSDQTYEQALLKLEFAPGGKLSFAGRAGGELRQYNSIGDRVHFVFDVSGRYQATEGTLATLVVNRKTSASAEYSGENIVSTTYKAGLSQRLLRRFYLSLTGGFVNNQYENNHLASSITRRDDYYYGRGSLACDVTRHGTIEVFYESRQNDSSFESFEFTENLFGASVAILF